MEERDTPSRDPHLSQAYRDADHPEPSPALDARILEAARQAVARPPARKQVGKPARWFVWALPLSSAAVLVLGVTLLLEVRRQAPENLEPPGALTSPGGGERADAAPAPLPAEPTQPRVAPEAPARQAEAAESVDSAGAVAEEAPGRTPEVTLAEQGAAPPAAQASQSTPPTPAQAAAKAEARPMSRAAPTAAQDAAEAASGPGGRFATRRAGPSPADAGASSREVAPAMSQALGKRQTAAPLTEGPEHRVETIRRLLREGRLEEARGELEKLRREYPGFALPEDLKGM